MTNQQIAQAVAAFATDLDSSCDMADRKFSVELLAEKVGASKANEIAEVFGLKSSYYKA